MIDNYTKLDLEGVKILSNYKPCDGVGFNLSGVYLLLREDSVIFDTRYEHGRNVTFKGSFKLIDNDLEKILKKKIKKYRMKEIMKK